MAIRRERCGSSVVIQRKSGKGSSKEAAFSSAGSVGSPPDDSEGEYDETLGEESDRGSWRVGAFRDAALSSDEDISSRFANDAALQLGSV